MGAGLLLYEYTTVEVEVESASDAVLLVVRKGFLAVSKWA